MRSRSLEGFTRDLFFMFDLYIYCLQRGDQPIRPVVWELKLRIEEGVSLGYHPGEIRRKEGDQFIAPHLPRGRAMVPRIDLHSLAESPPELQSTANRSLVTSSILGAAIVLGPH